MTHTHRWDRCPPPYRSEWCAELRDDPITGLVAWPQFELQLPGLLVDQLGAGRTVGLAIGDCDEFKSYVETERVQDPRAWGHQVGNKVMAQLGGLARWWLAELSGAVPAGVRATFGGDEVIVVLDVTDAEFRPLVTDLRDRLRERLPVIVSFAFVELSPDLLPPVIVGDAWPSEWTGQVVGQVDHALFGAKRDRRDHGADIPLGFVIESSERRTHTATTRCL